jgi:hypothetical protein
MIAASPHLTMHRRLTVPHFCIDDENERDVIDRFRLCRDAGRESRPDRIHAVNQLVA